MIEVDCPTCGKTLYVPEEKAGQIGKCPCGERLRIPGQPPVKQAAAVTPPPATSFAPPVARKPVKRTWIIVGGAAAGCLVLGLVLFLVLRGRKPASPPKTPLEEFKLIAERLGRVDGHKHIGMRDSPTFASISADNMSEGPAKESFIREDREDRQRFQQGYKWIVWYYTIKDVAFDVQKTDSLVSPYTGYIEFTLNSTATDWILKSQAEGSDFHKYFKRSLADKVRVLYAYQGNHWVLKNLQKKSLDEQDAAWKSTTFSDWWSELDRALTP